MSYSIELLIKDLILMAIAYCYVFATILIPVGLKKKDKISKYTARKIVHLFAGLVVVIVPYFNWPFFAIIIAGSLTILTYFSQKESKVKALKDLYDSIGEEAEEEKGYLQGPFNYCLSITILVAIFAFFAPHQMYFPIAGILIMIISDTLASMVGRKIGKRKIKLSWTGSERTLEGSSAFFISAFLLCLFSFSFFGIINPINQNPLTLETALLYSLITSALATLIELISPSTWDDLTVPIATTIIIFLLTLV
ncbi:MAG: diacylglycerol/polyprenol kinase family protein [Promethearchaeota archaeon]